MGVAQDGKNQLDRAQSKRMGSTKDGRGKIFKDGRGKISKNGRGKISDGNKNRETEEVDCSRIERRPPPPELSYRKHGDIFDTETNETIILCSSCRHCPSSGVPVLRLHKKGGRR